MLTIAGHLNSSASGQFRFGEDFEKGSGSRQSREQAIASLPIDQLNQATQRRVMDVIDHTSVYRRMPVVTIESDPEQLVHLVRFPETIVNIWQLMGVSQMTAERVGEYQLSTSDGVGTTATADLIYGSPTQHIYYCEGEYEGPLLLRSVEARCIVVLNSEHFQGRDGKQYSTNRLDIFMKIDNLAASVIARTVHPLVGTTADHNFVETLKFVENLYRTTCENGPGVQRLAQRLEKVSPPVRAEFADVAGRTFQRSRGIQTRPASNTSSQVAPETNTFATQTFSSLQRSSQTADHEHSSTTGNRVANLTGPDRRQNTYYPAQNTQQNFSNQQVFQSIGDQTAPPRDADSNQSGDQGIRMSLSSPAGNPASTSPRSLNNQFQRQSYDQLVDSDNLPPVARPTAPTSTSREKQTGPGVVSPAGEVPSEQPDEDGTISVLDRSNN